MSIVNAKKVGTPQEPTLNILIASNFMFYFCLNSAFRFSLRKKKFWMYNHFSIVRKSFSGKMKRNWRANYMTSNKQVGKYLYRGRVTLVYFGCLDDGCPSSTSASSTSAIYFGGRLNRKCAPANDSTLPYWTFWSCL